MGSNGWELDPALQRNEQLGTWRPPVSRALHDAQHALLPAGGSLHYFVRALDDPRAWKASITFLEQRPPAGPPSFDRAITQVVMEDARDWADSKLHPLRRYECPLPQAGK